MPERNGSFERCPRIRAGHGQTCRYYIPSQYTYDTRKVLMSLLQLSSYMSMSVLRWDVVLLRPCQVLITVLFKGNGRSCAQCGPMQNSGPDLRRRFSLHI